MLLARRAGRSKRMRDPSLHGKETLGKYEWLENRYRKTRASDKQVEVREETQHKSSSLLTDALQSNDHKHGVKHMLKRQSASQPAKLIVPTSKWLSLASPLGGLWPP